MEMKSNQTSAILTDPAPANKSRLGTISGLLPHPQAGAAFPTGKYVKVPRKKPGKLDDVHSNGWLDAMKSSSPPRKKLIKDFTVESTSDETDSAHHSWMLKYPSALHSFKQITEYAKNKKIVVFLDYDGTLSPIVDDPDHALMSYDMRSAVRNVAKYFPTAIISARCRDQVYELVGLAELYYAGSHGMDIMGPVNHLATDDHSNNCIIRSTDQLSKEVILFQPAKEFIPMIDEVFRTLVENTKGIQGSKVENHKFCVSVHYRNVDEKNWPIIAQLVHDILKNYPRLQLTHGRKVLEVRPMIDWNKGKAVEFLLDSLGLSERDDVLSIYIGDDKTDEDAFKVLREKCGGYGILVSSVPKETKAFYSLKDPSEVMKFMESLVRWKNKQEEA